MSGVTTLPPRIADAAADLLAGARAILREDLVALWLYGAATWPDPPAKIGDLDAHVIVRRPPDAATAARLRALHTSIEDAGTELDVWYVTLDAAVRRDPPVHALDPGTIDTSWALHRAHLLAGRCIVLHGEEPRKILAPPSWEESRDALAHELRYVEEFLGEGWAWAYSILNCCRVVMSAETRDVVVSKRDAGGWAREAMPGEWQPAIEAAARSYEDRLEPGDVEVMRDAAGPFLAYCRARAEAAW